MLGFAMLNPNEEGQHNAERGGPVWDRPLREMGMQGEIAWQKALAMS